MAAISRLRPRIASADDRRDFQDFVRSTCASTRTLAWARSPRPRRISMPSRRRSRMHQERALSRRRHSPKALTTAHPVEPPHDLPPTLRIAAEQSLATSLLPRLPGGYSQELDAGSRTGSPQGGEWQKIALGRAGIRDAQVLILDEPTAALDARAEYEVSCASPSSWPTGPRC